MGAVFIMWKGLTGEQDGAAKLKSECIIFVLLIIVNYLLPAKPFLIHRTL